MNSNILKGATLATLLCTVLTSCEDKFVEYNTNSYEATYDQMLADDGFLKAYITQMERSVILYNDGTHLDSDYQIAYNLCADTWAGYFAPTGTWNNGVHNGSYSLIDQWCAALFNFKYADTMNAWSELRQIAEEAGRTQVMALANIIKVASMHQVADYYGPIPYSEVGTTITPKYDSQQEVYNAFFTELDDAIDVLTDYYNAGNKTLLSDIDLVYGGDVSNWLRFANSLRLRLAMRISYADETLAQTEIQKSLTHSMGLIEDNSQNALIASIPHHPVYQINVSMNNGDCQMGASMDCYLNGYNDPRKFKYAKAAEDGELHGVRNGIITTSWTDYRNPSGLVSAPAGENYHLTWMNAAEVWFLRAEIALRNWSSEDVQTCYEKGVTASFDEWGAGSATEYLHNATSTPAAFVDNVASNGTAAPSTITIAWDNDATNEVKLERIMTQKWLALFPNGCEAWAEYRRTGYPGLLTVVNNRSNGAVDTNLQIRRAQYPVAEYTNNAAGIATALTALGGADNGGTKLWWDKKTRN